MKNKNITKIGIAHIMSSFNNTIITISDLSGSVLFWTSSGSSGFKGTRKSTAHAATVAAELVAKKAKNIGLKTLYIELRGPGNGRDIVVRTLKGCGFNDNFAKG